MPIPNHAGRATAPRTRHRRHRVPPLRLLIAAGASCALLVTLAVVVVASTSSSAATHSTRFSATEDTYVAQSRPDSPRGDRTKLAAGHENGQVVRTYVKFAVKNLGGQ